MKKKLLALFIIVSSFFVAYAEFGDIDVGADFGATGLGVGGSNFGAASSSCTMGQGLMGILGMASCVLSLLIPILVSAAVVAFFWFIVLFIWKGTDNPDKQQEAKKGMFWSIIALFVMVSIWGIINFFGSILGVSQGGSIQGFIIPGKK
jgi:hypothetical protein